MQVPNSSGPTCFKWSDRSCGTHRGSDSRQRPEGILEPYAGAVDFGLGARTMSVQSGNGAGLLEVEQRTSGTIGLAPVLILSASDLPMDRAWALRWPWAGKEISGDCVVERYREIFRDCSWARSIHCDSRCTLFLSFAANWQFSSIR